MTTDNNINASVERRIYVASLSDYNAGRLHGAWINASQTTEAIQGEVDEMLKASPEPIAEEWAIHDYDGFGCIRLSEWESFENVAKLARLLDSYGEALLSYVAAEGMPDEEDAFLDAYMGEFANIGDYAYELAQDLGVMVRRETDGWRSENQETDLCAVWPFSCIDWDCAGRELVMGGDVWTADSVTGIYVFRNG